MSFQGYQGSVGTVGSTPAAGSSAAAHLTATQARIEELKRAQAARQAALNAQNLTTNGLALNTQLANAQRSDALGQNSAYQIIGGKAVPRGAAQPNIARSVPSILTRDGRRLTADSPNLTDAQKSALGIITAQQQATYNLAQQVSAERRAQQLSGLSVAQAQEVATKGTDSRIATPNFAPTKQLGMTKAEMNILNTALQTDIIRSNAAKLDYANQLIQAQTHGGEAGTLDNLKTQLASAPNQDQPIQKIDVSTDNFGNVVSPRNVKLQIENAGFTGGLTQPVLNIIPSGGAAPNVEQVAQVIDSSFQDVLDNAGLQNLTTTTVLPDGTLAIDFAEGTPEIFRQQFADTVYEALGQFFNLKGQGVEDFFQNPEGLRLKIGEEEVSVGGTGGGSFASGLLDEQQGGGIFNDILGFLLNPLVLIGLAIVFGFIIFTKVRK